jgi:PAS domain S-box-containing protein
MEQFRKPVKPLAREGGARERLRTEEALRESEERFRAVVDAAREIICTVTPDGRFTWFNPALEVLTGWRPDEWIGREFQEIVHPSDVPACVSAFETALRGEKGPIVCHRLRTRSGRWLPAESTGSPIFRRGRVVRVLGLVRDSSLRVIAEEALATSRRRLAAIFENALDAMLLCDERGNYVDANPAAVALLGYSRRELLTMKTAALIPPQYEQRAQEIARAFAADGQYSGDYRLARKDGTVLDVEFRAVANILPGLHLGVVRDVTDRKHAEEERARSQRRLEEAEQVAHVGSWEWDVATDELTWTAELYRLFGMSPGESAPSYDDSLGRVHPDDRAYVDRMCRSAVQEGRDYTWQARIVRPSGEVRVLHARGHAVRDEDGRVVRMIGMAQDISDRTKDEETRRELVQRLISAQEEERARLSRELHDGAGQSLTALLVGLRHLDHARSLETVRLAAARQRELVAQTLDEISRLARGLRPTALDDLGLRAALERHAADQEWLFGLRVVVDASGLGRRRLPGDVETALYRAAQEALANAARHAQAREVRIAISRDAGQVRLLVADDGRGFDVSVALAAGGGLGLRAIRERATLLGGAAEIRSAAGEGTSVTVTIPVVSRRRRAGA